MTMRSEQVAAAAALASVFVTCTAAFQQNGVPAIGTSRAAFAAFSGAPFRPKATPPTTSHSAFDFGGAGAAATGHTAAASTLRMAPIASSALTQIRGPRGRPILSEDDVATPPSSSVIKAVESTSKSGGGSAVIASDIATKAGVSLSQARRDLSTIATLTGGDISVSSDGELIYTFPKDIRGVMSSNSARFKALQTFESIWPKLFYGIRVGFGVVLFASIFAIFSTIFLVLSSSGSSGDDRDDRRRDDRGMGGYGGGYGMNNFMFDLLFPRWGFGYSPYYGYYGRVPYSARYYGGTVIEAEEKQPSIFERIFSYIVGDGNPNYGIENARLRAAAQLIRDNGGAVCAEQLAPFVDAPPPDKSYNARGEEMSFVDESYVLPIVTQLGGEPTVTDDGDIVYVFEELQMSAENTLEAAGLVADATSGEIVEYLKDRGVSTRSAVERSDLIKLLDKSLTRSLSDPTAPLQEEEIKFNRNGAGWNALAGALGAVNLGGALYLGQILSSPAMAGVQLPSYFGLVQAGYPLLLAYAVLYNIIPAARYLYNKNKNAEILERNAARRSWSTVLRSMGEKVRRKIRAAKKFRTGKRRLGRSDSVYDTRQDVKQLEAQREEDVMNEFDRLLRDNESFQ
mmetsp:Transcript_25946/g.57646  ORF Transcript_25946/g.57646 Transcript_25946/m.57646 type:complete len:626 (+) Transcript_25946:109-1986(+)